MTRFRVFPYKQGSRSARALADTIGGRVLKLEGSRFRKRPGDILINWGNSTPIQGIDYNGDSVSLRRATNKLEFFNSLGDSGMVPRHWTSPDDIPDDAFPVVCRTVLTGHSGVGITVAENRDGLVPAPLYTQYVKKESEFRIHVGKRWEPVRVAGDRRGAEVREECVVISEQQKVRRRETEPTDWRIRNLANGFVFQRHDIEVPPSVRDVAKATLDAIEGLTFGAVDVIFNRRQGRAYALEVNTAPGLEGTTVEDYVRYFRGEA